MERVSHYYFHSLSPFLSGLPTIKNRKITSQMSTQHLSDLIVRLEVATAKIEAIAGAKQHTSSPASNSTTTTTTKSVSEFKSQFIDQVLAEFIASSSVLGDLVIQQANLVSSIIHETHTLLTTAANHAKPGDWPSTPSLITPFTNLISQVVAIKDDNKGSPESLILSAIADGVPAFGWICMEPKPCPYISDMKDAAQFYINRVIKDNKNNPTAAFVHKWAGLLTHLHDFVKLYYPTGIKWNASAKPVPASLTVKSPVVATSAPAEGGNSLFAELNKGANITASLKKVVKDTAPLPPTAAKPLTAASPPVPKKPVVKQGNTALQGNKIIIENYAGKRDLVVSDTSIKTVVYIYGCTDCAIEVKGKVNSITIDNCKKSAVLVDSIVSTMDLINTKNINLQVTGTVPTVSVENSDASTIYFTKQALTQCQIFTCKSSQLNLMVPNGGEGEYLECPVPEQFLTTYNLDDHKFVTAPVEHKG